MFVTFFISLPLICCTICQLIILLIYVNKLMVKSKVLQLKYKQKKDEKDKNKEKSE